MQDLLVQIVKGIVNNPDAVSVEVRESVDFPGLTILEVTVSDEDKGILIGRKGRTINAIRDLMTISAIRHDKKVKVLVKDDRPGRSEDGGRNDRAEQSMQEDEDNSMNRIDAQEDPAELTDDIFSE